MYKIFIAAIAINLQAGLLLCSQATLETRSATDEKKAAERCRWDIYGAIRILGTIKREQAELAQRSRADETFHDAELKRLKELLKTL